MAAEAWISTTIGEQATLQRGIDITKAEQRVGKVPVISSGGISSYHDTVAVKGPGVVLGRKGVVGSVYYVEQDYWPHDTSLWVKDFHGNHPRFVYYFFKSVAPQIAQMDVGSANPTLNRNHVHPIPTSWPPLPEQKAIAAVLGALDDKIELNRRMNATLEAMARALFQSWFVDFDPVRAKAEGRPPAGLDEPTAALFPAQFQDSELGEIPQGWEVGSILKQADLLSGGTPKTSVAEYWDGDIPWASAKDVSQCGEAFLIATERQITTRGLEESATKMIPALATVVVARGATTGRLTMLGDAIAMNQTCYGLLSKLGAPFFLYCRMRTSIERMVNAAHGSVFDTITTRTFETTQVLLPPADVQRTFDRQVEPLFQELRSNLHQSRTLAILRDALLPKLLNGNISVPHP